MTGLWGVVAGPAGRCGVRGRKGLAVVIFAGLLGLLLTACRWEGSDPAMPHHLRVGLLPAQELRIVREQHGPLLAYLEAETGLPVVGVYPETYDELAERFAAGDLSLAHMGGYLFMRAHLLHGAEPLVTRLKDTRYTSYFLVRNDSPGRSLEELAGHSLAFGPPLSASGHLMPRHYLKEEKELDALSHFGEVRFTKRHDETVELVVGGVAGVGVASADVVEQMVREGRLDQGVLRVVWQTPPFVDNPWVVRGDLPGGLKERIRGAFLKLAADREGDLGILTPLDSLGFLPVSTREFRAMRRAVQAFDRESRQREEKP